MRFLSLRQNRIRRLFEGDATALEPGWGKPLGRAKDHGLGDAFVAGGDFLDDLQFFERLSKC